MVYVRVFNSIFRCIWPWVDVLAIGREDTLCQFGSRLHTAASENKSV